MQRRNFLQLLAALPFVGKLVPSEPEQQWQKMGFKVGGSDERATIMEVEQDGQLSTYVFHQEIDEWVLLSSHPVQWTRLRLLE